MPGVTTILGGVISSTSSGGTTWYVTEGAPGGGLGKPGDIYINTTNYTVYVKGTDGVWVQKITIKGDKGDPGDGAQIYLGAGWPAANLGRIGDIYVATDGGPLNGDAAHMIWRGDVCKKTADGWGTPVGNIAGSEWISVWGEPTWHVPPTDDDTPPATRRIAFDRSTGKIYSATNGDSWFYEMCMRCNWLPSAGTPSPSLGNGGDWAVVTGTALDDPAQIGDVFQKQISTPDDLDGEWVYRFSMRGPAGPAAVVPYTISGYIAGTPESGKEIFAHRVADAFEWGVDLAGCTVEARDDVEFGVETGARWFLKVNGSTMAEFTWNSTEKAAVITATYTDHETAGLTVPLGAMVTIETDAGDVQPGHVTFTFKGTVSQ